MSQTKVSKSTKDQKIDRFSYIFSWVLLAVSISVLAYGAYTAFNKISQNTTVNITLNSKGLSDKKQSAISQQIKGSIQGNFFTINIQEISNKVGELDWVQSVKVSREWPDNIIVSVLPRAAVARYGSHRLLSGDGGLFNSEIMNTLSHKELPLLFGPKGKTLTMMRQYGQLNQWFAGSNMRLKELSLTEQMTWFLKFDNGLSVIVDKENTQEKLYTLSLIFSKHLNPLVKQIKYIDLRYRNGMAVAWHNTQPKRLGRYLN